MAETEPSSRTACFEDFFDDKNLQPTYYQNDKNPLKGTVQEKLMGRGGCHHLPLFVFEEGGAHFDIRACDCMPHQPAPFRMGPAIRRPHPSADGWSGHGWNGTPPHPTP
jgi:hypothetical protein